MEALLEALTKFGLPGVVVAIFVVLYVKKDQELKRERDARIEDAKAFRDLVLGVQEKALTTANRLADIFDELKRTSPRRSA